MTVGINASVRTRSWKLSQFAGRAPLGWVTASEGSLAERNASRCLGLGEGIDLLTLCVSETKVREDDRVDLRDGEGIAVEDNHRPWCSSDEDSSGAAVFASRLERVDVEGPLGLDGEEEGVLRVDLDVFVVLAWSRSCTTMRMLGMGRR